MKLNELTFDLEWLSDLYILLLPKKSTPVVFFNFTSSDFFFGVDFLDFLTGSGDSPSRI